MRSKMYKETAFFRKMPLLELVQKADTVRRESGFEKMDICTIFNAKSGKCTEDCKFCAQSSYHRTDTPRYPLKRVDEIFQAAFEAYQNGAQSFGIVCSGNKPTEKEFGVICDATEKISRETGKLIDEFFCAFAYTFGFCKQFKRFFVFLQFHSRKGDIPLDDGHDVLEIVRNSL